MVSSTGMIDGFLAIVIVVLCILIGIFSILKSKTTLQKITGIVIICMGLTMLGPMIDFFTLLATNINTELWEIYPILGYIWILPILVLGAIMGAEAILPGKKKLLIIISALLGIIFEIVLFYTVMNEDPMVFIKSDTSILNPNESLLNMRIIIEEMLGIILIVSMIICLVMIFIIDGIGFMQKAGESSGVIKNKFILISLGWILFIVFGVIDSIIDLGDLISIPRMLIIISAGCLYLGTRPS